MQQPPTTTVIIAELNTTSKVQKRKDGMNEVRGEPSTKFNIRICGPQVGPQSCNVTCPSCRAQIRTQVRHEATNKTHLIALLLCLFMCWPCVCVPYCMDSCKNANHYCPGCGSFIGSYSN